MVKGESTPKGEKSCPTRLALAIMLAAILLCMQPVAAQGTNAYGLSVIQTRRAYDSLDLPPERQLAELDSVLRPFYRQIVYQTENNFTGTILYNTTHRLILVREAANALRLVQDSLQSLSLNLLIYDAYRPYSITEKMWQIVPDDRYAANPAKGSMHNRGLAVDIGLADAHTGKALQMPTGFDDFTKRAWIDFEQLDEEELYNRNLLQGIMKHFGFRPITTEWWHFYWPDKYGAPLLNLPFDSF